MKGLKNDRREHFIVIDGLDGIGKGEIIRALDSYEQKLGRTVLDTIAFSRANRKGLPELKDFWNPPNTYYNTIITAEPTYSGIGQVIREEIISRNNREYTTEDEIEAYSLDRLIQMKKTVIPALINGVRVIQSRCMAATLAYQSLRAEEEGRSPEEERQKILQKHGSINQLDYAPSLLIIPTIKDVDELIRRIETRKEREKNDNAIFESLEFQRKLKPLYESSWLKEIFEARGTEVKYLDAGISVESSRTQAIEIYQDFLSRNNFNRN